MLNRRWCGVPRVAGVVHVVTGVSHRKTRRQRRGRRAQDDFQAAGTGHRHEPGGHQQAQEQQGQDEGEQPPFCPGGSHVRKSTAAGVH